MTHPANLRYGKPRPAGSSPRAGRGAYAIRALSDLCLGKFGSGHSKTPPWGDRGGALMLGTLKGRDFSPHSPSPERKLTEAL
jgi:hypothetical protein